MAALIRHFSRETTPSQQIPEASEVIGFVGTADTGDFVELDTRGHGTLTWGAQSVPATWPTNAVLTLYGVLDDGVKLAQAPTITGNNIEDGIAWTYPRARVEVSVAGTSASQIKVAIYSRRGLPA